jgi:hypothetical protein
MAVPVGGHFAFLTKTWPLTTGTLVRWPEIEASSSWRDVLTAPFREVECAPASSLRPGAFVCVVFDFVSEIWMIDHFDSGAR